MTIELLLNPPFTIGQKVQFIEPEESDPWLKDWQNIDLWVIGIRYDIKVNVWTLDLVDCIPWSSGDITDCNASFLKRA